MAAKAVTRAIRSFQLHYGEDHCRRRLNRRILPQSLVTLYISSLSSL